MRVAGLSLKTSKALGLARCLSKTLTLSALLCIPLAHELHADCTLQLFNITATKGTKISEFVDQISDECGFSVIVKDDEARNALDKNIGKLNLRNATFDEVMEVVLKEHGLSYMLEKNILKISFLTTKTFHVDYVTSKRVGESTTDASVDIGTTVQGREKGRDINKITSNEEFDFWKNTKDEIMKILNRPEDKYKTPEPIINPEAGLITVTATAEQLERVEGYIKKVEERLHRQVLIEVSILAVTLDDGYTKGVNWSNFNFNIGETNSSILSLRREGTGSSFSHLDYTNEAKVILPLSFDMDGLINFLETNGDVHALSNPKILTLNNQQALITIGDTINYNVPTEITLESTGGVAGGTQAYEPASIFVGILLNITPEISDTGEIILRINPSVSELKNPKDEILPVGQEFRKIAPDTKEKKISSVVKVKDGSTIVLGGLITSSDTLTSNGVPILRDIPILGYAFKSEGKTTKNVELVFVIKPKIVKDLNQKINLKDLGYSKLSQ